MKTFEYSARRIQQDEGNLAADQKGVVKANTREEAIAQIRADGLIVTSISEVNDEHDLNLDLSGRKTRDNALALMCSQFSIVLRSGLPIVRAIRSVADQTDDRALRETLVNVADDVESGIGLADSFAKYGKKLPITFIETVRAGEDSGNLVEVFDRLADYYRTSSKTRTKVRSALIYPAFVLAVAVVVVIVIMVFAVPTFKTTFETMGVELPWPTRAMIATSDFMVNWLWLIVVVVVAAIVVINLLKRFNERFRLAWAKMGCHTPAFGKINVMSASSQFASTMSTLMSAGIPVVSAVDVTAKTLSNAYMGNALMSIKRDVESGKTVAECLAKTEAFPAFVCEMVDMGEQTGTLESTLAVVADYYDSEVEARTDKLLRLLEPIMIVVLAAIVLVIVLAVYLPMFSIYGGYTSAA